MLEDLVLDDSMGDDNSTAPICMYHDVDLHNDTDSQMISSSTNTTTTKPTKMKLSLRQYLSIQKKNNDQI